MTVNIYDMAQTWNDGATTFTGIKMNVTDTASASGSLLMDLQVGGSSRFNVDKTGKIFGNQLFFATGTGGTASSDSIVFSTHNGISNSASSTIFRLNTVQVVKVANIAYQGFGIVAGGVIAFCSSGLSSEDLFVRRDAANTLALRNGANAQAFNIYNTYTDASNYERGFMKWSSNVLEIGVEAAGTGSTRVVHISNLPTSNPGAGILWNNAGTPAIGT